MERLPSWESDLGHALSEGPRCGPSPIYKSHSTVIYRVWSGLIRRPQIATDNVLLTSQKVLSQRVPGEVQQALHALQAPDEEQDAHEL